MLWLPITKVPVFGQFFPGYRPSPYCSLLRRLLGSLSCNFIIIVGGGLANLIIFFFCRPYKYTFLRRQNPEVNHIATVGY